MPTNQELNAARLEIARREGLNWATLRTPLAALDQFDAWVNGLPPGGGWSQTDSDFVASFDSGESVSFRLPAEVRPSSPFVADEMLPFAEEQYRSRFHAVVQQGDNATIDDLAAVGRDILANCRFEDLRREIVDGDGVQRIRCIDSEEYRRYVLFNFSEPYRGESGIPLVRAPNLHAEVIDALARRYYSQRDLPRAIFWARVGIDVSFGHPCFKSLAADIYFKSGPIYARAALLACRSVLTDPEYAFPGRFGFPDATHKYGYAAAMSSHWRCTTNTSEKYRDDRYRAELLWALAHPDVDPKIAWGGIRSYGRSVDEVPERHLRKIMRRTAVHLLCWFPDIPEGISKICIDEFAYKADWLAMQRSLRQVATIAPRWAALLAMPTVFAEVRGPLIAELHEEMRAILKTTVSFRTKDLLKRILAGFTSIQQIDGARPLFFVCLEDPECTFEAIDGIPPVIWPLVPDLDLRAELKRINTLCTQFGVAVDSMDWLPRHTGRLLRCPDLQVETLKKIPPWFWVYLARADVIELETAVEPTGNVASQSTINPKRWQPVFLNYGGQFERWRVVNAAIRELGSSASEASGEIKPVTVMAEWNKSKPVRLMLKLGIDRTTLRATSAGAVVFEGAFQPLPATADLLHRFVRSERDVKGDFRHPTWQQLDPEQRVNIAASLGDKVTTAAITRTKQYAEWCALYASAHTAMRYYCALDGLGASTGIAVVYSGEVISALSLVSDLGW